jgi:hypothetical protein
MVSTFKSQNRTAVTVTDDVLVAVVVASSVDVDVDVWATVVVDI